METRKDLAERYRTIMQRRIDRYANAERVEMLGALIDACHRLEPLFLDPDKPEDYIV